MLIIGLTGGIGSGKSTICKLFTDLGVPVIDADIIARQVVAPDQPALGQIKKAFGEAVITKTGQLDRSKLRSIVFDNPTKRKQLEAILHPAIQAEMQHQAEELDTPYCIFAIPLLIEVNQISMVDRILVVDAPDDLRRQRIKERDQLEEQEINAIFAAQLTREERLVHADDIIRNDSDIAHLQTQVLDLNSRYLEIAKLEKYRGK